LVISFQSKLNCASRRSYAKINLEISPTTTSHSIHLKLWSLNSTP